MIEGIVFLAVLVFGFGGGVVYKTEKCKEEKAQVIEQSK